MVDPAKAAAQWDAAYAQGNDTHSWYEEHPHMSLRMLGAARLSAADAVIDVGGGASPLARALLDRGFGDLTVLDISATGMQHAPARLGPRAARACPWRATVRRSCPPGRRQVATDQPGPGRAHYPGWHYPAVHLDRAATTVPEFWFASGNCAPSSVTAAAGPVVLVASSSAGANGTAGSVVDQGWCWAGCRSGRQWAAGRQAWPGLCLRRRVGVRI